MVGQGLKALGQKFGYIKPSNPENIPLLVAGLEFNDSKDAVEYTDPDGSEAKSGKSHVVSLNLEKLCTHCSSWYF